MENKIIAIKEMLREIHYGRNVDEAKEKLKDILLSVKPWEIPIIEQQLIKDGITVAQIANMCNVHIEIFKSQLNLQENLKNIPEWHPLDILLKENENIIRDSELISFYVKTIENEKDKEKLKTILEELKNFIRTIWDIKNHYLKLQLIVYPYLERRGITAVPRVLWTKEDEIMDNLRDATKSLFENKDLDTIIKKLKELSSSLSDQVYREDNILYPTIWVLFKEGEWAMIHEQFFKLGFYKLYPSPDSWKSNAQKIYPFQVESRISDEDVKKLPEEMRNVIMSFGLDQDNYSPRDENSIVLNEGYLNAEEINSIFHALPFEITFIDKNDRLKFFNDGNDIYFKRTKATVGRKVELCHPPKSVHMVKKIIEDFKNGKRDVAEFWINIKDRKIHIRYFPVRDSNGEYLGTLEVVQDITDIKKIEGEKRLMDFR